MSAPRAKTFQGQLAIWIIGGIGAGLLAIATLVVTHVLTWFDPPDPTELVLAQNAALIESLNNAMSRMAPANVVVVQPQPAPLPSASTQIAAIEDSSQVAVSEVAISVASAEMPPSAESTVVVAVSDEPAVPSKVTVEAPPAVTRTESSVSTPSTAPSESVRVAAISEPGPIDVLPQPQTQLDVRPSPTAVPADPLPIKPAAIAVFEGEKFEVCGHSEFSAALRTAEGKTQIVMSSNDRSIPGRTFRGFERALDPGVPLEFWPGCKVAAGYTTVSTTTRIAISILGEDQ